MLHTPTIWVRDLIHPNHIGQGKNLALVDGYMLVDGNDLQFGVVSAILFVAMATIVLFVFNNYNFRFKCCSSCWLQYGSH